MKIQLNKFICSSCGHKMDEFANRPSILRFCPSCYRKHEFVRVKKEADDGND